MANRRSPTHSRASPLTSFPPMNAVSLYRKKLQLDASIGERPSSHQSGSSTEESPSGASDTASAGESPAPPAPHPRTDAAAPRRTRRLDYDNDSSATETADEENDAPAAKVSWYQKL